MLSQNEIDKNILNTIISSHREAFEFYHSNVRMIIGFPLALNAGASTALISIAINKSQEELKCALIFFIIGTLFGVCALCFEFLFSAFTFFKYDKCATILYKELEKNSLSSNQHENSKLLLDFLKNIESNKKNIRITVLLRILNGGVSILMGILGIFCVSLYIYKSFLPIFLLILFIFYVIAFILFMWCKVKGDGELKG